MNIPPQLVTVLVDEIPGAIQAIKDAFVKRNPGLPVPTSEEVIAGFDALFASSYAKDAAWLTAHP